MPVVAVINRKGGCGKSTLATTLASWCASEGHQVMVGDIDKQQSVKSWLDVRPAECPPITSWAVDNGKVFRAPPGTTHVVLDTPGGLYDYALAKLLVYVDAVVVPVGPSLFDLDATRGLLEELVRHPRVSAGRCQVALVGMRWPQDSGEQHRLRRLTHRFPLLTIIPEDPLYRQLLDLGRGLFDLSPAENSAHLQSWRPLLQWLSRVWQPEGLVASPQGLAHHATPARSPTSHADPRASARPHAAAAVQEATAASAAGAPEIPVGVPLSLLKASAAATASPPAPAPAPAPAATSGSPNSVAAAPVMAANPTPLRPAATPVSEPKPEDPSDQVPTRPTWQAPSAVDIPKHRPGDTHGTPGKRAHARNAAQAMQNDALAEVTALGKDPGEHPTAEADHVHRAHRSPEKERDMVEERLYGPTPETGAQPAPPWRQPSLLKEPTRWLRAMLG